MSDVLTMTRAFRRVGWLPEDEPLFLALLADPRFKGHSFDGQFYKNRIEFHRGWTALLSLRRAIPGRLRRSEVMRMLSVVAWLLVAVVPAAVEAAEVRVLSAGAMKAMVSDLGEAFQRESGHTLQLTFDTVGSLRKRAAVKAGAPRPDLSTPESFKQALLAAKSIVYTDPARGGTSGIHFATVLQRLGIAEAVKDKTVLWPGGFAAEAVATGQAELCVHQISEILPVKGVTLVGPLPRDLQKITTYSGGVVARSDHKDAARALLTFLARPDFRAKFAAAGLDYKE
jgi:molybdate transport system substrate-binding protein